MLRNNLIRFFLTNRPIYIQINVWPTNQPKTNQPTHLFTWLGTSWPGKKHSFLTTSGGKSFFYEKIFENNFLVEKFFFENFSKIFLVEINYSFFFPWGHVFEDMLHFETILRKKIQSPEIFFLIYLNFFRLKKIIRVFFFIEDIFL